MALQESGEMYLETLYVLSVSKIRNQDAACFDLRLSGPLEIQCNRYHLLYYSLINYQVIRRFVLQKMSIHSHKPHH